MGFFKFNSIKLKFKLTALFIILGLIPFIVVSVICHYYKGYFGIAVGIMIVFIGTAGFLISNALCVPLKKGISELSKGVGQMGSATRQTFLLSRSTASSASEMASTLEEIGASIQEIANISKDNLKKAGTTNSAVKVAGTIILQTNTAMQEMEASMSEMLRNNDEIAKIIKLIEEISFQTNLLALNAAVEAARAGEAGAGFAVVAEEVRSLAQRSAGSAGEINEFILNAVHSVKTGNDKVNKVGQNLKAITEKMLGISSFMDEVASSSEMQNVGIDQIARSVIEMNNVVQSVASNIESNSAASEEMNAQAESLNSTMAILVQMVEGSASRVIVKSEENNRPSPPAGIKRKTKEIPPTEILPLDGDEEKKSKKSEKKQEDGFRDF
ncbi:MAG: hypothetical protein KKH98_02670 [Spirochaetes bacterium]|nr:hypothetical protein [Spirochaetota bacterium]